MVDLNFIIRFQAWKIFRQIDGKTDMVKFCQKFKVQLGYGIADECIYSLQRKDKIHKDFNEKMQ